MKSLTTNQMTSFHELEKGRTIEGERSRAGGRVGSVGTTVYIATALGKDKYHILMFDSRLRAASSSSTTDFFLKCSRLQNQLYFD
jgi:hypothetical protein